MNSLLKTTIFKKQVVALSGLAISGFAFVHMAGNCLMFLSAEAYNTYGHAMTSGKAFPLIEIGLLLVFLVHIFSAISLSIQNRRANAAATGAMRTGGEKKARFGSLSMIYTGLLILVFLVLHLLSFRFGTVYEVNYNGVVVRDLHRLMIEKFNQPLFTGWYLLSLVVLGVHLSHGFSGLFQTLGFGSVRNPVLIKLGWIFAILVAGGFMTQPLYAIWVGGR